jgi:predicted DNA-binding transcriptional regulator AlpA
MLNSFVYSWMIQHHFPDHPSAQKDGQVLVSYPVIEACNFPPPKQLGGKKYALWL